MLTRSEPQPALPQPVETAAAVPETAIRLSELAFLEMKALHARLGTLIGERETEARQMFKAEFIERMAEYGMSLDDFKPGERKTAKKRETKPNPADPCAASGRRKPPVWMPDLLEQGRQLKEFAILTGDPAARTTET